MSSSLNVPATHPDPGPPSLSLSPTLALRPSLRRMTHFTIDIVSDTVCPWCYVGKNRLERAMSQHRAAHPADTFATAWHPFQLNPDAPAASVDKQEYYERKFGAERTRVMQAHLARIGAQAGIPFAFAGRTGNTRDSHRLIALARAKGEPVQTAVVQQLFEAFFERNEDITARETLVTCGVKAGLAGDEVAEWLASGKGGAEVDEEVAQAQARLVTGVPNFTINGRYEVRGAEEPTAFLRCFEGIRKSEDGLLGSQKIGGENVC